MSDIDSLTQATTLRQQLSSIVGTVPFGIITISDDAEVDIINSQAVLLLGFPELTPSDLVDQPYPSVLLNIPELLDKFERFINTKGRRKFDLKNIKTTKHELSIKCRKMQNGSLIVIEDMTNEKALIHKATHDNLTQLSNRQHFEERAEIALTKAQKHNLDGAIVFIDLDRFKPINDTAGHAAGDELLRRVAIIMQNRIRNRDTVGRIGGDEFAILLTDCPINIAKRIIENIRKDIEEMSFSYDGRTFNISMSAGIAEMNKSFKDLTTLMNAADTACQYSKNGGRNHIHVIDQKKGEFEDHVKEVAWFEEINKALANDNFILYAQQIAAVAATNTEPHYEILLRLKNEGGTTIAPAVFMPPAERYEMMPQLDRWVLKKAFQTINPKQSYAINLSEQSLADDSLAYYIDALREKYKVDASKITFEITETSAIHRVENTMAFITYLKKKGFKFSLDDFGTGLSSYSYLRTLAVDYLKIDGRFIKEIVADEVSLAMVKSINDVGHSMGLETIAEFVEDQKTLDILQSIGVDYAQGYHLHQPQSLSEISHAKGAALLKSVSWAQPSSLQGLSLTSLALKVQS